MSWMFYFMLAFIVFVLLYLTVFEIRLRLKERRAKALQKKEQRKKQVLLILDDDVERIWVRTYHRDFPGAETWDVGSDHSLDIDDGDKFDLRLDSKEEEHKE